MTGSSAKAESARITVKVEIPTRDGLIVQELTAVRTKPCTMMEAMLALSEPLITLFRSLEEELSKHQGLTLTVVEPKRKGSGSSWPTETGTTPTRSDEGSTAPLEERLESLLESLSLGAKGGKSSPGKKKARTPSGRTK
jgi:hypothetical protein